jgi:hypothetical protein
MLNRKSGLLRSQDRIQEALAMKGLFCAVEWRFWCVLQWILRPCSGAAAAILERDPHKTPTTPHMNIVLVFCRVRF